MPQGRSPLLPTALGLAMLGLAGCAHPESTSALPLQQAPAFSEGGDSLVPERWWTAFNDPGLDQRVERALTGNFSLEAAWERLRAARALAERERADLFPDLDGLAGAGYEDGDATEGEVTLSLGLEARYEVDLWGRIRSRAEAERFRARASAADYQTAALTLSAEVARAWYQLAEARAQLALLNEQITTNETIVELLEERFATGQIRSADVLRQRQLVEATREQAIAERARIARIEHLLAVLEGEPAQAYADVATSALPSLPPVPRTGLPADLLQRRPDVRAAFELLRAADRDLAAAVSNQYPRLDLTASLETAAEKPENLFRDWFASVAGQLVAPLLDGGERAAEVERNSALKRQRLAEYGQTVVEAFRDVEDALVLERRQFERIQSIDTQLRLARQTLQQLRTQYLNGVTDYIAVLDALTERQRLERDLLTARLNLLEFRIALYRALAGDFETPPETVAAETGGPRGG